MVDIVEFEEVQKCYEKDGSTVVHYLAKIDGVWYSVPVDDDGNRHCSEIKRQVTAGTLTIKEPS
tara:strand:+ start:250 stop:441 length:192 start_codon:yes stop_codon:yes gene_type:complete